MVCAHRLRPRFLCRTPRLRRLTPAVAGRRYKEFHVIVLGLDSVEVRGRASRNCDAHFDVFVKSVKTPR